MRTLIAILLMTGAAAAQEPETLEQMAYRCWNIPAGVDRLFASEFDVDFNDAGEVQKVTIAKQDKGVGGGDLLVASAAKAIQRCSPYQAQKAGVVRIKMDPMQAIK